MICLSCRAVLPEVARFCLYCGCKVEHRVKEPEALSPIKSHMPNEQEEGSAPASPPSTGDLDEAFLNCYVSLSISRELAEWLRDLGLSSSGTTEEKIKRIQEHAKSIVLPAETPARQTIFYLSQYNASVLSEICQELGLSPQGSKDVLLRRIYYEVGRQEGWLKSIQEDLGVLRETFVPMLSMLEAQSEPVGSGARSEGSRIESDPTQREPSRAHISALATVMVPYLIQEAQAVLLKEELRAKGFDLP